VKALVLAIVIRGNSQGFYCHSHSNQRAEHNQQDEKVYPLSDRHALTFAETRDRLFSDQVFEEADERGCFLCSRVRFPTSEIKIITKLQACSLGGVGGFSPITRAKGAAAVSIIANTSTWLNWFCLGH
jgi:hypothetical protein